jgi:hypothetical protein
MSGPSDKAKGAADRSLPTNRLTGEVPITRDDVQAALAAAHDPALGLDRSVCLRDMVEWLRGTQEYHHGYIGDPAADLLARKFGGS